MQKTDKTCIQIIDENDIISINIQGEGVSIMSLLVHTYEKLPDFEKMVRTILEFKDNLKKEKTKAVLPSFGDKAQA